MNISDIYEAARVLEPIIERTPLIECKLQKNVYLKAENLQKTGAFKIRGAYYKISKLNVEQKKRGVLAASAGNHAQGVAKACQMLGIECSIVMPKTAPLAKINATRRFGATVILQGDAFNDAYEYALHLQTITKQVFIEPFDDLDIIKGQGTIGLEILKKRPEITMLLVPVGGGGLISGIAYAAKTINPKIKVIGVQASGAPSMKLALDCGERMALEEVSTMADGIAVKVAGKHTFALCQKYVDEIITIDENEIAASILYLVEEMKMVAEGAGAISLAPLLFNKINTENEVVCCVISGGNIDVNFLAKIIDTGLVETGRKATLEAILVDKPGNLVHVLDMISKSGVNIVSVDHERTFLKKSYQSAKVSIVVECNGQSQLDELLFTLQNAQVCIKVKEGLE